jgi:hypothetical protein
MRALVYAIPLSLAFLASGALAQPEAAQSAPVTGPEDTEKVKQVFVYGEDPCPPSVGDEIVVCARMPDGDRYRIPKELRTDPNSPVVQSWANRARSIEYVGASGADSCSPTGSAGFTGCFAQISRAAREERQKMLGSGSWSDAVAKAREDRLGNLDAESEQIEAQARADGEAARIRAERAAQQQGPAVTQ